MKKYFYVALVALASATMFVSCDQKGISGGNDEPTDGTTYAGDTWITSPEQFDMTLVDDSTYSCWDWHAWCDGTTISVVPFWGTEALLLWMIDQSMQAEMKVFGEYHKKYRYYLVEENTEEACMEREWEGAECWLETITWIDSQGGQHTNQEYGWMPEANMKERHDYYMAKLEQIGVANHTYERVTDKTDKDACWAMNPEDTTIITPPDEPKDYSKYDSLTYRCWMVTQTSYGMNIITYVWMTERQVNEYYDQMKLPYVYEPADANDEDACMELNENSKPDEGEEACWKITTSIMGQNSIEYTWGTEAEVQAIVNAINGTGLGTATYTKASANDPDSCEALND